MSVSDKSKSTAPSLQLAALEFKITPDAETTVDVRHGGKATEIASGLKTMVMMLEDKGKTLCLVTTHFGPSIPVNVSKLFRETLADDLDIPVSNVLIFTSHNHTSVALASNGVLTYNAYATPAPEAELLPVGETFFATLRKCASRLRAMLVPVTVSWAEGSEDRITYYRKGRRENGTTYLMREEDREQLGDDFQGDVDHQAPIIIFKNVEGDPVAGLVQFTGHPVTAYHPENTVVFGEWSQVACDIVSGKIAAPVGFLQGCAGDVNSKEMFTGGVSRSTEFGEMLGESYLEALESLRESGRDGMDVTLKTVRLPLASLPSPEFLNGEMTVIDDFMKRAEAGDENTLECVGQNFAKGLSPQYRAWLISLVRPWNLWALDLHEREAVDSIDYFQEMEIAVIRIGDVGIVGLPCEPFQNIGRQIREQSPLPLTIPCGYMNINHGYIADSENLGDNEYMSAHHRYTKFRAPLKAPAGDVLATEGVKRLKDFSHEL
ncbi:hypothetical protein N9B73_06175 [Verrucomicrobiales bacterium]|jgi:hypothetical protein|nr:hypothetical protein [Verrucomicrobiales bacterium]